jgi:hypothetical protein
VALDTYANLKTAIGDHLNRSDLTSFIDDFIDIAESMHKRDVRIREMIQRDSITIDSRQEAVPAGVLEIISLRLMTTPVTVLEEVNIHEMNRIRQEVTGRPFRFTVHEEIEFDVAPDASYSGEIIYYGSLTPLSGAATSNALLAKAPDLYLYGALVAASPFLLHDERVGTWGALYENGVKAMVVRERSGRRAGPLISRVAGAIP